MTIRLLAADALKAGDPALTRYPLDHARILARRITPPSGPITDQLTRDAEHLADWLAHVDGGRVA